MKLREPVGALQGLRTLAVEDLELYKAAVAAGQQCGWGYYFPYLLSRNRRGRSAMLVCEDDGSLCLFLWQHRDGVERLDPYLPPVPASTAVLKRCIERANEFNGNLSARVMRIDEKDVPLVADAKLRVKLRRLQYVYAPDNYAALSGKAFQALRRQLNYVERLDGVERLPFEKAHAPACRELLKRWKIEHRVAHGTAGGTGSSKVIIDLAESLPGADLRGEVVFIDGMLVAFAFGGEIRPGLACSFERKCETSVRGLSYFHLCRFLEGFTGYQFINDGSDAGRAGLRQLKDTFRPVEMHGEYRAHQPRRAW